MVRKLLKPEKVPKPESPMIPVAGSASGIVRYFRPLIKIARLIILAAGLIAFAHGACRLGLDLFFSIRGEKTTGRVVGQALIYVDFIDIPVYGATIRYIWPPGTGDVYFHDAIIGFDEEMKARYPIGSPADIRVLPYSPARARAIPPFTHYLWASLWFGSGLMVLVLAGSLFYLPEAFFGGDVSKGVSLFRSMRARPAGCLFRLAFLIAMVIALSQLHQHLLPWIGFEEGWAIVTGEMRLLPPLLAAKGSPPPGGHLNDAERAMARIPGFGIAFADEALEAALRKGDDGAAGRYLAAMADPDSGFRVQSPRVLAYAAEKGKTDFVRRLLAAGMHPDTAVMAGDEPIRMAARHNHGAVIAVLLAAGAKSDYPAFPLLASAIAGRGREAATLLMAHTRPEPTWREPQTGYTLADLALRNGLVDIADSLKRLGVPATLPGYYNCVVNGDTGCLAKHIPLPAWKSYKDRDETLLYSAVRHGQLVLAEKLISLGTDPNAKSFDENTGGATPLIQAVITGNTEMVRFLSHLPNIRIDLGDVNHITPLAHAVRIDRWDVAEMLVAAGANVNTLIGDADGNTLLHVAVERGDVPKAKWLLDHGADAHRANFRQVTPYDAAWSLKMIHLLNQTSDP
jgi:ankyrin repeat protein